MAFMPLPINGDAYQNIDQVGITRMSPRLFDGYVAKPPARDEPGVTVKRPGLNGFAVLGTGLPVQGLYWWQRAGVVIAASNRSIFSIDSEGTVTDITGDLLTGGNRVSFTDNGDTLVMADRGPKMLTYAVGGSTAEIADVDAPSDISFLGYLDGYILAAGDDSNNFYYSDLDAPTDWQAVSFEAAEGNPDYILAMDIAWREILLVGGKSVEIWFNDGTNPFSRKQAGYTERGIGARYTLIAADNTWFWLDNFRRLVRLEGATPKIVSTPFDKVIANMNRVDDAFSVLIEADGRNFIVITFPSEGKTLVYDYARQVWAEWSYWDAATAQRTRYRGNCSCYAEAWGKWLVGDMANGKIHEVDPNTFDDDGDVIRFERRLGHVNHGSNIRKRSSELIVQVKRGTGNDDVTDPQLILQWRNNNGEWGNEHWKSLGKIGENEVLVHFRRLGIYRTRQYSFVHTDKSSLVLVSAEEDVKGLTG